MLLIHNKMDSAEHLSRMKKVTLPKHLFYWELHPGKHPRCKPKKCFKDIVKKTTLGHLEDQSAGTVEYTEYISAEE